MTSTEVRSPGAPRGASTSRSLAPYLREFLRYPSPWVLAGWFTLAMVVRILVGDWGWADLIAVGAMILVQPFVEWVMHVVVLHFRPRTIRGRIVDLHVAREHRRHHVDPKDVPRTFIPHLTLAEAIVGITAAAWLLSTTHALAATITAFAAVQLSAYEWTHFLIHTSYRPKGRHFRSIAKAHRLHHYRNERYWMGVTSNAADRMLGTFPERSAVELSPTARNLTGALAADDAGEPAPDSTVPE